jgi:phosphatidylserine/phosphatidylglycerophosphate/cardiolipin synthase-like enzyme
MTSLRGPLVRFLHCSLVTFALLFPAPPSQSAETVLHSLPAEVCFSPEGRCADRIIRQIDAARSEILVQAFSFTSGPIRNALIAAKQRGVKVEVILDKTEQTRQGFRTARTLSGRSVIVYIDDKHSSAHNKVILVDRSIVITGSYNFTYAADDKNAENVLLLKSGELAKSYVDNWFAHRDHSLRYSP